MTLTTAKIQNAKPKSKPYKLFDGDRLYLIIRPSGSKSWKLDYEIENRTTVRNKIEITKQRKTLSIGSFPIVSLGDARMKKNQSKRLIAKNGDPSKDKKLCALMEDFEVGSSFENVATSWLESMSEIWTPNHKRDVEQRLKKNIYPYIGHKKLSEIKSSEVLAAIRLIEKRGALEMSIKCLHTCGQIFNYGIAIDRCNDNPTSALKGALKRKKVKHHPRLKESELAEFFSKLEGSKGDMQTQIAIKLIMLTMVRTTELRAATFDELDFEKKQWRIPNSRMKVPKGDFHIVPLSVSSLKLFEILAEMSAHSHWLLPQTNNPYKYMSENAMLYRIYRLGYHNRATIHGMRSTASTILNENRFRKEIVDMQLAHFDRNEVSAAYNDALYLDERVEMMNWWAEFMVSKGLRA